MKAPNGKATILFRITAVLFVLFAAGHTFGFLSFRAPTQEAQAVFESMNNVHFEADGKIFSYGGWYRGFGLSATASMLFEAFLAWYLGGMAKRGASEVKALGWAFFLWQLPGVALAWIYYGPPPMVLSLLVAVLIAAATRLAKTKAATEAR
jgi:succinate dehydrogenase/fumarate reductase cytochrome b subunit